MASGNKVRIYDLAKDLKQDTKRIIEDARREGVDVDVPSNSVSKEVAEKIRSKYFPKKDSSPHRLVKLVKKAVREEVVSPVSETVPEPVEAPPVEPISIPVPTIVAPVSQTQSTVRKVIKLAKPLVEVADEIVTVADPKPEIVVEAEVKAEEPKIDTSKSTLREIVRRPEVQIADVAPIAETVPPVVQESTPVTNSGIPGSQQVTKLKVRHSAVQAKVIENAPKAEPKQVGVVAGRQVVKVEEKRVDRNDRNRGRNDRRPELRGTPGESATPQTVYTPPASSRKPGRGGGKKGGRFESKDSRFQEREFDYRKPLSVEERLLEQYGSGKAELQAARLTDGATVRDFAEKLNIAPRDIVQLLIKRGIFATLNQPIVEKIAVEVGKTFGYDVTFVPFEEMLLEEEFEELIAADSDDTELPRAPVITVMGHVDHGKTSLLDVIRSANVAEGEAGGITQHIGAYSVLVPSADHPTEKRRVVFLDTPGHEAFTMMRSRGAKATDIVILVVAADDGVMPQTIEAIEHSKAANVPMIVAINKVDKPNANVDRVKTGLAAQGLQPLDWGGDTEMVEVSARMRTNLDTLLETVLLTADILNLKASPTRRASGVVLESKLDKGRGAVATVLVQQGTLKVGDPFIVGQVSGRVRAMFSDKGETVIEASPATPVEVLGLQGVPNAGDLFQVVADVERAQQISNQRQMLARQASLIKTTKRGLESLGLAEFKELLIVLKTDVQGSIEVLKATLEKLSTEKVKVRVIRSGVGAITESDVLLASATQADNTQTAVSIIGFNVRPESRASEVARQEDVDIRLHSIIYKVEEEIHAAMVGMLDAIEKETITGKAEIREVFKVSKVGSIAGCGVLDGYIKRNSRVRLIRDGVVAWEGELATLKRFKDDVAEVRQGFECGISLANFNDIKVGDQIEGYIIESIAATEL